MVLGFFIGLLVSAAISWLSIKLFNRQRRFLISILSIVCAIAVAVGINKLLLGVYDIPIAVLVGTVFGPIAAFRLTRPFSFNN